MDVCRTCLENTGTIDIFENTPGISICSKIMYCCVNIQIHKEDGLPVRVCSICETELSLAYQFVLKCEAAYKKLQSLSSEIKLEENVKLEFQVEEGDQLEFDDNFTNDPFSSNTKLEYEIQQYEDSTKKNLITFPNIAKVKTAKKKQRKVHGNQKCKECGRQCRSQSCLIIHMRTHSDERPFACQFCEKRYKDSVGLKRHIERNHTQGRKREAICEICGKAFYSIYEVKIHTRTHTGETPYACSVCPSKFTQHSALFRHELRHTGKKAYSCSNCKKTFHTKDELKSHQISHSSDKNFICSICNAYFKYKNNLRKHILQHNPTINFVCDYCGRAFKTKGNLKIHINCIHSGKSGTCFICTKDVPNLEIHMWKHNGKRPLQCHICSSSFYAQNALTQHINFKHKHNDKFKCTVDGCLNTFPTQIMLEYHVSKFHGSSTPFPCDTCSRRYYRRSDLTRHKQSCHEQAFAVS